MPAKHPAQLDIRTLLADCEIRRQRRSGPGGQHRNKVETGIFIRHLPTSIEAAATERRSQQQNQSAAIHRLRIKLAIEHQSAGSSGTSELWESRCRGERITVSACHEDFPALLAEAFNILVEANYDMRLAAERLRCSRSQLTKLLRLAPMALAAVNKAREQRNLSPLR